MSSYTLALDSNPEHFSGNYNGKIHASSYEHTNSYQLANSVLLTNNNNNKANFSVSHLLDLEERLPRDSSVDICRMYANVNASGGPPHAPHPHTVPSLHQQQQQQQHLSQQYPITSTPDNNHNSLQDSDAQSPCAAHNNSSEDSPKMQGQYCPAC